MLVAAWKPGRRGLLHEEAAELIDLCRREARLP